MGRHPASYYIHFYTSHAAGLVCLLPTYILYTIAYHTLDSPLPLSGWPHCSAQADLCWKHKSTKGGIWQKFLYPSIVPIFISPHLHADCWSWQIAWFDQAGKKSFDQRCKLFSWNDFQLKVVKTFQGMQYGNLTSSICLYSCLRVQKVPLFFVFLFLLLFWPQLSVCTFVQVQRIGNICVQTSAIFCMCLCCLLCFFVVCCVSLLFVVFPYCLLCFLVVCCVSLLFVGFLCCVSLLFVVFIFCCSCDYLYFCLGAQKIGKICAQTQGPMGRSFQLRDGSGSGISTAFLSIGYYRVLKIFIGYF